MGAEGSVYLAVHHIDGDTLGEPVGEKLLILSL